MKGEGRTLGKRATRTRRAILEAAEEIFAERGFAATRVEDVAERVGIRRASIVYYFRNKRDLYEAVLESVFSDLEERIAEALGGPEPLPQRIEACVAAWVEYVGARPSFARLLLREVADGGQDHEPLIRKYTRPYFELVRKHVVERPDPAARELSRLDPVHIASAIAGGSVFFAAAIPTLVPELELDPSSPEQIERQREQVMRILPLLLGPTRSPSPRAGKQSPRR